MFRQTIFAMLLCSLLSVSHTAGAQTKWVMATPYSDGNFHTQNIRQFADDVRKATNGGVEITIHSNQSLLKMPEILRGVQTGQAQLGEILLSAYSNEDPFFEVDSIPYVSRGFDAAEKVWTLSRPYIEARLKKRRVVLLFSVVWPSQGLYTKQAVQSLADLKGGKFRAYNAATARFAQLIGAVPTTVQAAELAQAFATGVVDSMVTSAQTGVDTQVWDFAKFYIDAEIMNVKNIVVVNEDAFKALPANHQEALTKAAAAAEKRGWEMSRAAEKESTATLVRRGMTVSKPDAAIIADLKRIRDAMLKDWAVKAGADGARFVKALD